MDSNSDIASPNINDVGSVGENISETADLMESQDGSELIGATNGEFSNLLEPADEIPMTDADEIDSNEQIVESLRGIDGLREDTWSESDRTGRLGVLQETEDVIADIHGRPSVEVEVDDSAPKGVFGGYNPENNTIAISGWHIDSDDVHEVADTMVHEGRHAYQEYAMQNPGFHPDADEVEDWRENSRNYLDAETYGQEAYQNQPLEADAWENGSAIADRLYGTQNQDSN